MMRDGRTKPHPDQHATTLEVIEHQLATHDALVRHRVHELERLVERLTSEKEALERRLEVKEIGEVASNGMDYGEWKPR